VPPKIHNRNTSKHEGTDRSRYNDSGEFNTPLSSTDRTCREKLIKIH
jgi:hypothetical protein